MKKLFATAATALALVGISTGAFAALVTIDFSGTASGAAVEETRRLFSDVPWRIGSVIYAHPARGQSRSGQINKLTGAVGATKR
jgi:hypothetical protein